MFLHFFSIKYSKYGFFLKTSYEIITHTIGTIQKLCTTFENYFSNFDYNFFFSILPQYYYKFLLRAAQN